MSDTQKQSPRQLGELRKIADLLGQTGADLAEQRVQLRRRRLSMPASIHDSFAQLQQDFAGLEAQVLAEQTELRQLRALTELATRMTHSLDVDTVLQEAMELVIVLTQAERGYIILRNEDGGELEFRVSSEGGLVGRALPGGKQPEISRSVVNQVLESGEPLVADNAHQDERLAANESIINFVLRSVLCVPLQYKSRIIGVVYVDNRMFAGIFHERELQLMMIFANIAAVAIANARMYSLAEEILAEITRVKGLMDNIFSSVGSGIIAIDSDDKVQTLNRAAGELLAVEPATVLGTEIARLMQRSELPLRSHLELVKQQHKEHMLELSAQPPGRGEMALALSLSPLKDGNDTVRGITVVMDDITHLHEHEMTIKAMKRILPEGMVEQIEEIANIEMGGLRRELSCLFADLRPWATLPDVSASEKLRILNQYQALATGCIHETGGIIDKYMGNELMALFNTQLNPEARHAQAAVDCALLMRERFVAHYEALGIAPQPHYYTIGIYTGVATLGNIGSFQRRDFTALGKSINSAKRIQENAARGSITIGQATYEHLQRHRAGTGRYRFRRRVPIQGKGLSVVLQAYEVRQPS